MLCISLQTGSLTDYPESNTGIAHEGSTTIHV